MIAEEKHTNTDFAKPALSNNERRHIDCILNCMKLATVPFLQAYKLFKSCALNEDGLNNNGGIERFKIEKHGAGLDDCGMIAFVEKETFTFWRTTINQWIAELSGIDNFWQTDENLESVESNKDLACLKSIAHRKFQKDVFLHHLWINIQ